MRTVNPATGQQVAVYPDHDDLDVDRVLTEVASAFPDWSGRSAEDRAEPLWRMATLLRERTEAYATLITTEMGKPHAEAAGEVQKCAWVCEHYAEHVAGMLAGEPIDVGPDAEAYVQYLPLGAVLAIMPWNFPFWQVFRAAVPIMTAGNTMVLKHAESVTGCSLAIEELFADAGYPENAFRSLLIPGRRASDVVADDRIAGATLTGSERAGRSVAAAAGDAIKPTVLELGGSDPFIVLDDADVGAAAQTAVRARFQNAGQSCIAAKRFIVTESVADDFLEAFVASTEALTVGDPDDPATDLGPMARYDLRDELDDQVQRTVDAGGTVLVGGEPVDGPGAYYSATVIEVPDVDSPAMQEETFGPVAAVLRVPDEDAAIEAANATTFGLSASLWTTDPERARRLAPRIKAGGCFVNALTASDPRLPFGGVRRSGYGRELAWFGIRAFTNAQTVRIS